MEGSDRGLNGTRNCKNMHYLGIYLEVLRKITKSGHVNRSSGRDLNPVPPEYEGVLNTVFLLTQKKGVTCVMETISSYC
jgi:hypothetical protein